MANGWAQLGSELFGGPDPTAYDSGRLYTAQTEGALAKAEAARLDAIAKSEVEKRRGQIQEALAANGATPQQAMLGDTIIGGGFGSDYNAFTSGQLHSQEQQFRSTLADPTADPMAQFAAGQGVEGHVLSPYAFSGQNAVDMRAPAAPGAPIPIQTTPLGQAQIATETAQAEAANALAYQRMHPELNSGSTKVTDALGNPVQPGLMPNPSYDPTRPPDSATNPLVIPQAGSTNDPAAGGAWGTRERMMLSSVIHSALEAGQRLNTIMDMPSGANSGWLGMGPKGTALTTAIAENMKWALSSDEVNQYNTLMMGQARNLANLENYGRTAPSQAQIDSIYQALALRPDGTETVEGKMMKMADFRNTVENALHTFQAMNPRMPPEAARMVSDTLANIRQSVPFTMDDVNALSRAQLKNPRATLKDVMTQRAMTQPVRPQGSAPRHSGTQPTAGNSRTQGLPPKNDKGWDLMQDADGNVAYVGPRGEIEEVN